jgi:glycosyltransferase involved in cell wall biosynthesis
MAKPKITVISTLKNRAGLLPYGLAGILEQEGDFEIEILIGDGGSTDNLDQVLSYFMDKFSVVRKILIDRKKSPYNHPFNCPAWEYNVLVDHADSEYIVKIDPEFVLITPGFIQKAYNILSNGTPAMVMPFPHHVEDFPFTTIEDIKERYQKYEYQTHIRPETCQQNNVYYGCMFRKKDFIELGGIDMRFLQGIGSEDDHMMDQWRRKYGTDKVMTLEDEHGVHLYHGEWGRGHIPQQLHPYIHLNAQLRKLLHNTYPNNGNFGNIKMPEKIRGEIY